jgi:hypothetical protein
MNIIDLTTKELGSVAGGLDSPEAQFLKSTLMLGLTKLNNAISLKTKITLGVGLLGATTGAYMLWSYSGPIIVGLCTFMGGAWSISAFENQWKNPIAKPSFVIKVTLGATAIGALTGAILDRKFS